MNIFKPLKIDERIESRRKELVDKKIIIINNNSTKILNFKGNVRFLDYIVLYTFYKDYIVNVNGSVDLENYRLSSIDVQFNKVGAYFDVSDNNLTTLHNCPKYVGGSFWYKRNSRKFTEKEIREVCDVFGFVHTI
jgi:hypothetical protein